MKILSLVITIIFLTAPAFAKESSDAKPNQATSEAIQKFLNTTEIKLGSYNKTEGPDECSDGELSILPLENEFTLMLGAHPLVIGLGRPSFKTKDRACVSSTNSSYKKHKISGRRIEKCGKISREYKVEVNVAGDVVTYVRTVSESGKVVRNEKCVLKLEK